VYIPPLYAVSGISAVGLIPVEKSSDHTAAGTAEVGGKFGPVCAKAATATNALSSNAVPATVSLAAARRSGPLFAAYARLFLVVVERIKNFTIAELRIDGAHHQPLRTSRSCQNIISTQQIR
jgi:hypothetical protein